MKRHGHPASTVLMVFSEEAQEVVLGMPEPALPY